MWLAWIVSLAMAQAVPDVDWLPDRDGRCAPTHGEERFTCLVAGSLQEGLGPETTVVPTTPWTLALTRGEATAQVNLDNTWVACEARPDACADAVARLLRTADTSLRALPPLHRGAILPVLRHRDFVETLRTHGAWAEGDAPIARDFDEELVILYVQDLPAAVRYLGVQAVQELGLDVGATHDLALANLAARLPPIALEPYRDSETVRACLAGEDYASSRLLLPEGFARLDGLRGSVLVAVPIRNVVLVAPRSARAELKEAVEALSVEAGPVSSEIRTYTRRGWKRTR